MIILAVESSCDETAVALVRDGRTVLADCIASSVEMHRIYGGVVPEIASRKHIEVIAQLADQALEQAGLSRGRHRRGGGDLRPGPHWRGAGGGELLPSRWPMPWGFPHPGAPCAGTHRSQLPGPPRPGAPPFVCLCVSGGTSLLVDVKGYTEMEILGATRDDAAGGALTKSPG